jgi:hypothetical protein
MANLLEMLLQQSMSAPADATQYGMDLPIMEEEETLNIPDTAHSFIDKEIGSMSQMKPQVEGTGLGLLELAGKMVAPSSVTTLPNMIKQLQSTMKRMGNLKISSRQKLIDTANKRNYDAMSAEEVKKALDANKAAMKMAVDREELMTETQTLLDFLLNYQRRGF